MTTKSTPRIALIGASGFIGLRTVEMLGSRADFHLMPLVRAPSSLAVLARQSLDWRITSFLEVTPLAEALEGCEICVHAAIGDAAQIPRMADVAYRACAAAGVRRLVWLSSASVHGQNCAPGTDALQTLHDDHPLRYNNAKVRAEWELQKLARRGPVEVVVLRPGVVFGPRSRWITEAAAELRRGPMGWIHGGRGICNSLYVDNLVDAILLAALAPRVQSMAFLVGDAETVTWRDFLLPIAQHLGRDFSAFVELPPPVVRTESTAPLAALTQTSLYRGVGRLFPARAKRLVKGLGRAWPESPATSGAWTLRAPPLARLTDEAALLQQCTWKFSNARATAELGYFPRVTFADGLRRSLAWLDFAEGRSTLETSR